MYTQEYNFTIYNSNDTCSTTMNMLHKIISHIFKNEAVFFTTIEVSDETLYYMIYKHNMMIEIITR